MKTTVLPKTDFAALKQWNPHYQHHHLPRWFKNAIRPGVGTEDYLPRELFDHWGSIPSPTGGSLRWIYAMPYGAPDILAKAFAQRFHLQLVIDRPGPWNVGTSCYLFAPKP